MKYDIPTTTELVRWGMNEEAVESEKAKKRRNSKLNGNNFVLEDVGSPGTVCNIIAKKIKIGATTYKKARRLFQVLKDGNYPFEIVQMYEKIVNKAVDRAEKLFQKELHNFVSMEDVQSFLRDEITLEELEELAFKEDNAMVGTERFEGKAFFDRRRGIFKLL